MAQQETAAIKARAFPPHFTQEEQARYNMQYDGVLVDEGLTAGISAVNVDLDNNGRCRGLTLFERTPDRNSKDEIVWSTREVTLVANSVSWESRDGAEGSVNYHIGRESPTGRRFKEIIRATQAYHAEWRAAETNTAFRSWKREQVAQESAPNVTPPSRADVFIDPVAVPQVESYQQAVA